MHFIDVHNLRIGFPEHVRDSNSLRRILAGTVTGQGLAQRTRNYREVLRGVSFRARPGERIALVGNNGAGKTTLLRALNGCYAPDGGRIIRRGRVLPLLNTTLGMDAGLSGVENIFVRGRQLGFSREEMEARLEDILGFAELGEAILRPMKTYSSGMLARLAFAISTSVPGDIYLMDEWISAGDARFFERADERMTKLIHQDAILVLATHSDSLIRKWCNRVLVLKDGQVVMDTSPEVAVLVKNRCLT